jgi:hypothetical protein
MTGFLARSRYDNERLIGPISVLRKLPVASKEIWWRALSTKIVLDNRTTDIADSINDIEVHRK